MKPLKGEKIMYLYRTLNNKDIFTSNIHKIEKDYLNQYKNKVAVINSTNMIMDENAKKIDLNNNEKIVAVLEPIQVDLIYNNLFNEKFYQLSNYSKKIIYEMFKSSIKIAIFDNLNDIERMVYFEHYINCKSLLSLSSNNNELQKLISAKKNILSQIEINSCTKYMMNDKFKNIVLPEEKRYSK